MSSIGRRCDPSGASVAASDIRQMRTLRQFETFKNAAAHLISRLGWRFLTSEPQAVMNVLTPDVAIEKIKGIVMSCDGFDRRDGKPILGRFILHRAT